jgi:hypothetical protein
MLRYFRLDSSLSSIQADIEDVGWVYRTLDGLDNSEVLHREIVAGLLQALVLSGPIRGKPSTSALRTILSALSPDDSTEPSEELKCTASAALVSAKHWFDDDELGPILADESVWLNLGGSYLNTYHYTVLGDKLSNVPEWKHIVSKDLPGWTWQYTSLMTQHQEPPISVEEYHTKFRSVLSRVWGAEANAACAESEGTLSAGQVTSK